jgi:conjugal transfer pilus assembly protein TraW
LLKAHRENAPSNHFLSLKLALGMVLFAFSLSAKNEDGTFVDYMIVGEVFPIQEKNLIEVIQAKLLKLQADGKLESYNQQVQSRVKSQIERPAPVAGIAHTITPKTFTYDPSITVTTDLKDAHGTVFHHKGEKVNPLEYRSMTKPFLFIDGDESLQLTWAFRMLKIHPQAKIIFVKGAPIKIMQEIGLTIFFDQHGKITKKLGITQVPAIVTQEGKFLKIEEVKADADGIVEMCHQLDKKQAA